MYYYLKEIETNRILNYATSKNSMENTLKNTPNCIEEVFESEEEITCSPIDGHFDFISNLQEEIKRAEQDRINNLNLTKADFWIALLDRDITKNMVKEKIELIPDEKLKAKTLIRLDDADHFWRRDPSMDVIGVMFGITPEDLNYLFINGELPKINVDKNA